MAADFQAALETVTSNFDFHDLLLKEEKAVVTHESKKEQEAAVFLESAHLEIFKEDLKILLTQVQKVAGTFGRNSCKVLKGLIAFRTFKERVEDMTKQNSGGAPATLAVLNIIDTQIEATPAIKNLLVVTEELTPMTEKRGEAEKQKYYVVKDCLAEEEDSNEMLHSAQTQKQTQNKEVLIQEDNEEGFEIIRLLSILQTSFLQAVLKYREIEPLTAHPDIKREEYQERAYFKQWTSSLSMIESVYEECFAHNNNPESGWKMFLQEAGKYAHPPTEPGTDWSGERWATSVRNFHRLPETMKANLPTGNILPGYNTLLTVVKRPYPGVTLTVDRYRRDMIALMMSQEMFSCVSKGLVDDTWNELASDKSNTFHQSMRYRKATLMGLLCHSFSSWETHNKKMVYTMEHAAALGHAFDLPLHKERNGKYVLGWIMATRAIRDITLLPFMASSVEKHRLDSFRRNPTAYMVEHQFNLKTYDELTKGHLTTVLKEEEEKRNKEKGEKAKAPNNKRPRTDEQETATKTSTATVTTSLAELQLQ